MIDLQELEKTVEAKRQADEYVLAMQILTWAKDWIHEWFNARDAWLVKRDAYLASRRKKNKAEDPGEFPDMYAIKEIDGVWYSCHAFTGYICYLHKKDKYGYPLKVGGRMKSGHFAISFGYSLYSLEDDWYDEGRA